MIDKRHLMILSFIMVSVLLVLRVYEVKASPDTIMIQIQARGDDVRKYYGTGGGSPTWHLSSLDDSHLMVGQYQGDNYDRLGSGMRFLNVTIPQGAIISSAYLKLTADFAYDASTVKSRISAYDVDNASSGFSDLADFNAKYAHRTSSVVNWDNIPAWSVNEYGPDTFSPNVNTVIQEIVDRERWQSGNSMIIFWEDFDGRSSNIDNCRRSAYSWDNNATKAPKLEIRWTGAPKKLSIKLSGELDYSSKEDVPIRLSALVRDFETLEAVSGSNVTIEIYDPEGNLWISDNMTEELLGTGIYEWESSETIYQMKLENGVYLVYVKASVNKGSETTDILQFHIDPPFEEPIQLHTILLFVIVGVLVTVISVWYIDHRKLAKKKQLQRKVRVLTGSSS